MPPRTRGPKEQLSILPRTPVSVPPRRTGKKRMRRTVSGTGLGKRSQLLPQSQRTLIPRPWRLNQALSPWTRKPYGVDFPSSIYASSQALKLNVAALSLCFSFTCCCLWRFVPKLFEAAATQCFNKRRSVATLLQCRRKNTRFPDLSNAVALDSFIWPRTPLSLRTALSEVVATLLPSVSLR